MKTTTDRNNIHNFQSSTMANLADSSLGMAVIGVAVALAGVAQAQVEAGPAAGEARCTVLEGHGDKYMSIFFLSQ